MDPSISNELTKKFEDQITILKKEIILVLDKALAQQQENITKILMDLVKSYSQLNTKLEPVIQEELQEGLLPEEEQAIGVEKEVIPGTIVPEITLPVQSTPIEQQQNIPTEVSETMYAASDDDVSIQDIKKYGKEASNEFNINDKKFITQLRKTLGSDGAKCLFVNKMGIINSKRKPYSLYDRHQYRQFCFCIDDTDEKVSANKMIQYIEDLIDDFIDEVIKKKDDDTESPVVEEEHAKHSKKEMKPHEFKMEIKNIPEKKEFKEIIRGDDFMHTNKMTGINNPKTVENFPFEHDRSTSMTEEPSDTNPDQETFDDLTEFKHQHDFEDIPEPHFPPVKQDPYAASGGYFDDLKIEYKTSEQKHLPRHNFKIKNMRRRF